jgi:hypothetical protein
MLTFLFLTAIVSLTHWPFLLDVSAKGDGFAVRANLFYLMRLACFLSKSFIPVNINNSFHGHLIQLRESHQ